MPCRLPTSVFWHSNDTYLSRSLWGTSISFRQGESFWWSWAHGWLYSFPTSCSIWFASSYQHQTNRAVWKTLRFSTSSSSRHCPWSFLGLHWEKSSSSPENYPAKQQDRQHNYGSTTDQRMPGKRRRKRKGIQQWRLSELRSLSSRSAIWSNSITLCFISLPLQFPRWTSTVPTTFFLS